MSWTASHTFAVGEILTAASMNAYLTQNLLAVMPVGGYIYLHQAATRAETTINSKYLECNGTAVNRTTYGGLFSKISTTYGAGDGSTTFNLPDYAGREPIGLAGAGGNASVTSLGGSDGVALGNRRPHHRHGVLSDPGHVHRGATNSDGGTIQQSSLSGSNSDGSHSTNTATVGALTVGASASDSLDAPAYLVGGIYAICYAA